MHPPLFELLNSFFTTTFCVANKNYIADDSKISKHVIEIDHSMVQNEEHEEFWTMALCVSIKPDEHKKSIPYFFKISIVGSFHCNVPNDIAHKNITKTRELMYVNCATLLYSSIREYLRMITGAGPHGAFLLPTWAFDPKDTPQDDKEKQDSQQKDVVETKTP
jgi:preprotein translocase subunit SecB